MQASGTDDDGSTTCFIRSKIIRMARRIPSSLQVPNASTCVRSADSVRGECVVRRPSAIVTVDGSGSSLPLAKLRAASSALAGSAASTRMPGRSAFAAIAVPDISPPPPQGATTASRSGSASKSSSVAVACPAITCASSNGWISVAPVSRITSLQVASRAASVGSQSRTVAPKRRTFACLTAGAFDGITTHAGMPRARAA